VGLRETPGGIARDSWWDCERLLVGLRDFPVFPQRQAQKPDVETHQSARSQEGTRWPREEEEEEEEEEKEEKEEEVFFLELSSQSAERMRYGGKVSFEDIDLQLNAQVISVSFLNEH
jgi:hypothetical protein